MQLSAVSNKALVKLFSPMWLQYSCYIDKFLHDMPGSDSESWICTSYSVDKPIEYDVQTMSYICYGKETCPTTGRRRRQPPYTGTTLSPRFQKTLGTGPTWLSSRDLTPHPISSQREDPCRQIVTTVAKTETFMSGEPPQKSRGKVVVKPEKTVYRSHPLCKIRRL